jgi:hypothetical protein
MFFDANWGPAFTASGEIFAINGTYGIVVSNALPITWSSTGITGLPDLTVSRSAAGVLRIGTTTTNALGSILAANATFSASVSVASAVATPAAGSTAARLVFGTTAGFGIYYGSGAPTVSAAQGSIYLRSDGSGIGDRLWVNTNGTTGWTNFVSGSWLLNRDLNPANDNNPVGLGMVG